MKFLILSHSGCHAAESAIAEQLEKQGATPVTDELARFVPLGGRASVCRRFVKRLCRFLADESFDAIVCTHILSALAITHIKKIGLAVMDAVPRYFVATDYTVPDRIDETEMDAYCVPHEMFAEELIKRGIPDTSIRVYGIPVREVFSVHGSNVRSRERFLLPENGRVILLLTDGMGMGCAVETVKRMRTRLRAQDRLGCVCKRGERIEKLLLRDYCVDPRIAVVPSDGAIDMLMDAADVMVAGGGHALTEAAVKGVPLILTDTTGSEDSSVRFFRSHGLAITARESVDIAARALALADDRVAAGEMIERQQQTVPRDATRKIAFDVLEAAVPEWFGELRA